MRVKVYIFKNHSDLKNIFFFNFQIPFFYIKQHSQKQNFEIKNV